MNIYLLNKIMTRSLGLVIIILAAACHKEEAEPLEPISFAMDGFWDLQSMLCDKPVDLDFDRIYSNDIIAEIGGIPEMPVGMTKGPWWRFDYHMQFESRPIDAMKDFPTGYYQVITFHFPVSKAFIDEDNKFLTTAFGLANDLIVVNYSERKKQLEKTDHMYQTRAIVQEIILNRDGTISITYEQDFYTLKGQEFYTEEGWETLIITTTYKKRQDS